MLPAPTPTAMSFHGTDLMLVALLSESLALIAIFGLVLPVTTRRRQTALWISAWSAIAVASVRSAIVGAENMLRRPGHLMYMWPSMLDPLVYPALLAFLAALAFAIFDLIGRHADVPLIKTVIAGTFVAGLLLTLVSLDQWAFEVGAVGVSFVLAVVVAHDATCDRRRGFYGLAAALAIFGFVESLYLLEMIIAAREWSMPGWVWGVYMSSDYIDTFTIGLLGAAAIVVVMQDAFGQATEARHKRMVELAAAKEQLDDIIAAADEAIVITDNRGRITLTNVAASELFGAGESLVGHLLEQLFERRDAVPTIATESDRRDPPPSNEPVIGRRLDDSTFPMEFTVGRIHHPDRAGVVLVFRDTSTRLAAEAERQAFSRRVAESDKVIAIGRVVSGVAHELNSPLSVVLSQSEQLLIRAPAGELRRGLGLINQQAHRARQVVRDLRSFVRRDEGRLEVVDMVRLVRHCTTGQLRNASARDVRIWADPQVARAYALIDRAGIEQMLTNLIDNAIDAANAGGIIRVSITVDDDRIIVGVEDSGPGVPTHLVDRVFEPFFTTKDPGRGIGLGLAVSRLIAAEHNGTIRFENRPSSEVGARVVLELPLACDGASESADPSYLTQGFPAVPRSNGSPASVLLIDDEAAVRTTLATMFRRTGWVPREAASGDEALIWLRGVPIADAPALIVCDLKMPIMSGQQLYQALMAQRPELAPRFIFVTGDVIDATVDGLISHSGREVVEKPFTVAEIAGAVERTLLESVKV